MCKTILNKQNNAVYILKPIKWIVLNILLPTLPMFVKFLVNIFSNSSIAIFELSELLYYNFFICILLFEQINKNRTVFSLLVTCIIFLICVGDIMLIAFVSTGQQNTIAVWIFAISVAFTCVCFGSTYVIMQEKAKYERSNCNE